MFAEVLFSDNFDNQADWSVPYKSSAQKCNKEVGCTDMPKGYYGYQMNGSSIIPIPTNGHGVHLNSTNKRGSTGKGLTFWDQTDGTYNWSSGTIIGVDFKPVSEVYVRYWIKMQPGYLYRGMPNGAMMRKLNHISHYTYNGYPFTFFSDDRHFSHLPTTVNQLNIVNNNKANIYNMFVIYPDTSFSGDQPGLAPKPILGIKAPYNSIYNWFDLPSDNLPIGNYDGTGTEYNSPGMFADGNWHCFEFYLKNNTISNTNGNRIANPDGVYKFWMDGVLQMYSKGIVYRESNSELSDAIWNFVHISGNAYNAFKGPGISGEQWHAVDDLVISTTYSGPPAQPVSVTATKPTDTTTRLTWTAGKNGAEYPLDGYRIYYGTSRTNLDKSIDVGKATSYDIPNLTSGQNYYFAVTGFNKGATDPKETNENESIKSDVVSVKLNDTIPPAAATGLVVK